MFSFLSKPLLSGEVLLIRSGETFPLNPNLDLLFNSVTVLKEAVFVRSGMYSFLNKFNLSSFKLLKLFLQSVKFFLFSPLIFSQLIFRLIMTFTILTLLVPVLLSALSLMNICSAALISMTVLLLSGKFSLKRLLYSLDVLIFFLSFFFFLFLFLLFLLFLLFSSFFWILISHQIQTT